MKNYYYGLTECGLWIWFRTKKTVRNCKMASEICGESIKQFKLVPLFYQVFHFLYLKKEYKRGNE